MGALSKKLPNGIWEEPVDICKYRELLQIHEISVPVLSLSYESEAYQKLGRTAKAEKLQSFIRKAHPSLQ